MDRKHHYTCRCNDCVRQRNARKRRSEQQYAERGTPLPTGSIRYEIMGDHPTIYDDSFVATPRYRSPSEVHPPACTCVDCNAMRRNNNREPRVQPSSNPSSGQKPASASHGNGGVSSQQPPFAVTADTSKVLSRHGNGIYSLMVWGKLGGEDAVISQYSIFHGIAPPGYLHPRRPIVGRYRHSGRQVCHNIIASRVCEGQL